MEINDILRRYTSGEETLENANAALAAAIWAGVVPQPPPTMRAPAWQISASFWPK